MPKLTVITADTVHELPFRPGPSLRELLDAAGLRVRSGCRGNGACGLCLVQVEAGNVAGPTGHERLALSAEQLERRTRLACQLLPQDALRIRLLNPAAPSSWRDLPPSPGRCSCEVSRPQPSGRLPATDGIYGLAIDLGTTHISLSLWDLVHSQRLCGRTGPNPQSSYGSDVVTRLVAAGESQDVARQIARLPLAAVGEALLDMCSRNGLNSGQVRRVSIVGNTAMLALLTETDAHLLLEPRSWTRPLECRPANLRTWADTMGIHPQATIEVVPPLAGFVGSDLLAGVLATGLTQQPGGLLIDFGTNSEMALWDGRTLWVTSAAGGPAFESCGIQCGMPAEPGAIYRVDASQDAGGFELHVLGGGQAKGLCGSGLIDLVAVLRSTGALTPTGKFAQPQPGGSFALQRNGCTLRLTHRDVDMLQRAKAAIGVGIRKLLAAAQMSAAQLGRIFVCGVFGQHLNAHHAQRIGLLPGLAAEQAELCGNTALAGCERLLLAPAAAADLASLRKSATVINLSQASDFDALFMENLYLQPLKAGEP